MNSRNTWTKTNRTGIHNELASKNVTGRRRCDSERKYDQDINMSNRKGVSKVQKTQLVKDKKMFTWNHK